MEIDRGPTTLFSIQRTYILTPVLKSGKPIVTCDQRIDIPTIEPLVTAIDESEEPVTIIPCIELACDITGLLMDVFNFTFETNEGVTVLPIRIDTGNNPFKQSRYVLVLPRGATGIKSCKITHKTIGLEIPHNFTFGIMSPPYNYDNALLGYMLDAIETNFIAITELDEQLNNLTERVTALENKAGG